VDGGGIELVNETIELHSHDASVLAKGFWALVNLSLYDVYKDQIIARGGVEKIITAMR
jgi:hypothetical protein